MTAKKSSKSPKVVIDTKPVATTVVEKAVEPALPPEPSITLAPDPYLGEAKTAVRAVADLTGGTVRYARYVQDAHPLRLVVGLDGYTGPRLLNVAGCAVFILIPSEEADVASGSRGMPGGFDGLCVGVPLDA
jgi:hypothetical protein